jgi:hypothetical protein
MSATTVDIDTQRKGSGDVVIGQHSVAATTKIPGGVLVARDATGYAVNASDVAARSFAGVSCEMADNTSGAAADLDVRVHRRGIFEFAYTGALAVADIGKQVLVSDNQTVSVASTSHTLICGKLFKMSATSGKVWIEIDAAVDSNTPTT